MKVLHVHNVANVPGTICKALVSAGVDARFEEAASEESVRWCDVVHTHYAVNRKTLAALNLARRFGKPAVLHHHGSDVRIITASGMNPLPPWWGFVSNRARRQAAKVLLATPDLVDFYPSGTYVANPVDTDLFKPLGGEKSDRVLVCGRQVKGSRLVEFLDPSRQYDCINTGTPLKLPPNVRMFEPVPRPQFAAFLNRYSEMIGAIGDLVTMARMEAMACGLKTFSNFDEKYVKYYAGENPDKVSDPREFVLRHHGMEMVAKRTIEIYEEVLRRA